MGLWQGHLVQHRLLGTGRPPGRRMIGMYAALGYKDRICDLHPGDPTAGTDTSFFEDLVSSTVVGTGPPRPGELFQLLCTNGTGIGRRNAFEVVELGDNRIRLRAMEAWGAPDGQQSYLSQDDPAVAAGRIGLRHVATPEDRETFRFVPLVDDESVFALETCFGKFVTAERDGDGSPLTANRDVIGEWQRFMFLVVPDALVPQPEPPPSIADQVSGSVADADQRAAVIDALDTGPSAADKTSSVTSALRGSSLRDRIFGKR